MEQPITFRLTLLDEAGLPRPLLIKDDAQIDPLNTSSVQGTISAHGTFRIDTATPLTDMLRVGSAVLESSDSAVEGFAIFRDDVRQSEGTARLSTSSRTGLLVPYDNRRGYFSCVAIANLSNESTQIATIIRDQNGNVQDVETISLPPLGHAGIVLPDRFPVTSGLAGSIEFQSPNITGLALQFSPGSAFTSLPTIIR